jgi:hypothetical protein
LLLGWISGKIWEWSAKWLREWAAWRGSPPPPYIGEWGITQGVAGSPWRCPQLSPLDCSCLFTHM